MKSNQKSKENRPNTKPTGPPPGPGMKMKKIILSDADKNKLARELVDLIAENEKLYNDKAAAVSKFNDQIKRLELEIKEISNKILTGYYFVFEDPQLKLPADKKPIKPDTAKVQK